MKNIIISILLGGALFLVSFDYGKTQYPNEFYNVYLDNELLGTINSSEQLYAYIEDKTEVSLQSEGVIREFCPITDEARELMSTYEYEEYTENKQECVKITITDEKVIEEIHNPEGLYLEKVLTFDNELNTVEDLYAEIVEKKPFSVKGFEFIIRNEENTMQVNVLNKEIFETAINELIYTYIGEEEYKVYLNNNQVKIETTGKNIENVYIEDAITYKETSISVDEKIYIDSNSLANFLLFGDNPKTSTYKVGKNEMVTDIAFNNEVSVNEFLISNPKYTDKNALIIEGTVVQIKETATKISVVSEEFEVYDKESEYQTVYQYEEDQYVNYEEVIQEGSNGMERISQRVKKINGGIVFVEPVNKQVLKLTTNEIIAKGEKEIPHVGYSDRWAWPTASGWIITDDYAWRIHPITGERDFHEAIDIAGTGYNSPIYSVNNGIIVTKESHWSFGNYIVIDHNNGYHTLYAHMNKFMEGLEVGDTVAFGQQIGYMGSTGQSSGPHLHIEVWNCGSMSCRINPWTILR